MYHYDARVRVRVCFCELPANRRFANEHNRQVCCGSCRCKGEMPSALLRSDVTGEANCVQRYGLANLVPFSMETIVPCDSIYKANTFIITMHLCFLNIHMYVKYEENCTQRFALCMQRLANPKFKRSFHVIPSMRMQMQMPSIHPRSHTQTTKHTMHAPRSRTLTTQAQE